MTGAPNLFWKIEVGKCNRFSITLRFNHQENRREMFSCLFGQISAERNVKLLVDATVKSIQEKKDWVNQSIPPPSKADEADNIRGIGMFLLCDLMDIPAKDLPHVKAMGLDTPPKELIRNMLKKVCCRQPT